MHFVVGYVRQNLIEPPIEGLRSIRDAIDVVGGREVAVVIGVHGHAKTQLLQVACAGDGARLLACFGECRKQHGCQNGDDGDDN